MSGIPRGEDQQVLKIVDLDGTGFNAGNQTPTTYPPLPGSYQATWLGSGGVADGPIVADNPVVADDREMSGKAPRYESSADDTIDHQDEDEQQPSSCIQCSQETSFTGMKYICGGGVGKIRR